MRTIEHWLIPGGAPPVAKSHDFLIRSTPQLWAFLLQTLATTASTGVPPQLTDTTCPHSWLLLWAVKSTFADVSPIATACCTEYVAIGISQPPLSVESAHMVPLRPSTRYPGANEVGVTVGAMLGAGVGSASVGAGNGAAVVGMIVGAGVGLGVGKEVGGAGASGVMVGAEDGAAVGSTVGDGVGDVTAGRAEHHVPLQCSSQASRS